MIGLEVVWGGNNLISRRRMSCRFFVEQFESFEGGLTSKSNYRTIVMSAHLDYYSC